jgi:hypothetical protein
MLAWLIIVVSFWAPLQAQDSSWLVQPDTPKRKVSRSARPWYQPRIAIGAGLNIPELFPLEVWGLFGKYVGLRAFYGPEVPTKIRVEMPADVISSKKGVGVANPDFNINLKSRYGPLYGIEFFTFPFGGSYFIGAGYSYRAMELTGDAASTILVCSLAEAAKEPPCPDPAARLQTATELTIGARVRSSASLARFVTGWHWHISRYSYFALTLGATKPLSVKQSANVTTGIKSPSANDDIEGALAEIKAERETDLKQKALQELRPLQEKLLPIAGIAVGVRL